MNQDLAEMPLREDQSPQGEEAPDAVPVPHAMVPHLSETAVLLDIDGTLLDLAPTPREVWVPLGLAKTLNGLLQRTSGAVSMPLLMRMRCRSTGCATSLPSPRKIR